MSNTLQLIDGEVIAKLADGWSIRSGVYKPDDEESLLSGEYMRLVDPQGVEYLYYDQQEWQDEPALVMGAFINAAAGLRSVKKKVKCVEVKGVDCISAGAGYHYE